MKIPTSTFSFLSVKYWVNLVVGNMWLIAMRWLNVYMFSLKEKFWEKGEGYG
jgi:hypothetical protein